MNWWTDYSTKEFRPSIRPPAVLDELMDQFFTLRNTGPTALMDEPMYRLLFRPSIRPPALLDELMD